MNNSIPELVNSSVFCPAPWSNVDVSPKMCLPSTARGSINFPGSGHFPADSKAAVSAKLKHTGWADEVYNNNMSEHLLEFFQKTAALDLPRKQSFAEVFPETYQLLKGNP